MSSWSTLLFAQDQSVQRPWSSPVGQLPDREAALDGWMDRLRPAVEPAPGHLVST